MNQLLVQLLDETILSMFNYAHNMDIKMTNAYKSEQLTVIILWIKCITEITIMLQSNSWPFQD